MESTARSLRSGGGVPALKSPEKGPRRNSGEKSGSKATRLARGKGGKFAKIGKLAAAMEEAESFLGESAEEEVEGLKQRKRAREDEDETKREQKVLEEAEALSKKVAEDDQYLKELEERRIKALNDTDRYNEKAGLVKTKLKGNAATKKTKEIKAKLAQLAKLLAVIRNLVIKRQDTIYAAVLKEVSEAKHLNKKRRTMASTLSEDSDGDNLDVSEGKHLIPDFYDFSIPPPSLVDRPIQGDRPIRSDNVISMQYHPSDTFRIRLSRSATATPTAPLGRSGMMISSRTAALLLRTGAALLLLLFAALLRGVFHWHRS
jgi:hypothetical protein